MQEYPVYWGLAWYWWFFLVLLLVLIGIVIGRHAEHSARSRPDAALEELRRRYLAGEITAEEYRARKAVVKERKRAA